MRGSLSTTRQSLTRALSYKDLCPESSRLEHKGRFPLEIGAFALPTALKAMGQKEITKGMRPDKEEQKTAPGHYRDCHSQGVSKDSYSVKLQENKSM